jgi:predicted ATPase
LCRRICTNGLRHASPYRTVVGGDYVGARAHYERALSLLDRERDRELAFRFGQDQLVAAEILLSLVLWPLGKVAEAAPLAEAALRHATEGGQIASLAYLHMWAGFLEIIRRDVDRTMQHAGPLLALGREQSLAMYTATGAFFDGWARFHGDDRSGGLPQLRRAVARLRDLGINAADSVVIPALAEAEAADGNVDAAIAIVDEAFATIERTGQRFCEAEAHRIRGEILLKRDTENTAPAEQAFRTAIAIAQQQKAKSFHLRAALSLARLYQSTGRAADAHAVLAPALEDFSPTPGIPRDRGGAGVARRSEVVSRLSEAAGSGCGPSYVPGTSAMYPIAD